MSRRVVPTGQHALGVCKELLTAGVPFLAVPVDGDVMKSSEWAFISERDALDSALSENGLSDYESNAPEEPTVEGWEEMMLRFPSDGWDGAAEAIAAHRAEVIAYEHRLDEVDQGWDTHLEPFIPFRRLSRGEAS